MNQTVKEFSVLIAHSNKMITKQIAGILETAKSIRNMTLVTDGEAALAALNKGNFSCIVLDWKLEKISGPGLFNRIRQYERYYTCPILVVSQTAQNEGFIILKEYPPIGIADGPFSPGAFGIKYDLLMIEAKQYIDLEDPIASFANKLKQNSEAAKEDLANLIKNTRNSVPIHILAARKYISNGNEEIAENLLKTALKMDRKSIGAVIELAKIYVSSGRHSDASALLGLTKISAKNLDRILLSGEISLAKANPEDAEKNFVAALALDPQNPKAKFGKLIANNLKNFLATYNEDLPSQFMELLSMVGLALIKSDKQAPAGFEHLQAALSFSYSDLDKAIIFYNTGLGHIHMKKNDEALRYLKDAVKLAGDKLPVAADELKNLQTGIKTPA